MIGLAWRLLGRELRSGELRLLLSALVVAVASVTAVGFFADSVHTALERQAQQLMGGDLVFVADHPPPAEYLEKAGQLGLRQATTLTFPSMVMGKGAQLSDIKAVSATYPLRGQLSRIRQPGEPAEAVDTGPPPGSVWLDERLASALRAVPGDELALGLRRFRVAAILVQEPDRGINFFSLAPRLMMHADDIPATGLIQPGSRVTYRLLLAGDDSVVEAFGQWLEPRLTRGERLESSRNARPEIRGALDRAQRFLGLATLLTVVLSAVAVALAARRYLQRHLDACAVMRCMGMTQGRLLALHGLLFFWLALISAVLGCLLGFVSHFVLIRSLGALLAFDLPLPGWAPLGLGFAVAGVLLFGFAMPPLLQMARVPSLRVIRRELGAPKASLLGAYGFGYVLLSALVLYVAGDFRLGALAVAGFSVALGGFWLVARFAVGLIAHARGGAGFGWRQGLANLVRHATTSTLQIIALAVGLMAMLLLTVTRTELLDTWQKALPVDAPNRFVINIQPDQRQAVAELLLAAGIKPELAPMVRARLLRIGERAVSAASFPEDERAQRLIEREFNLSWRDSSPAGNRLVEGRWFTPQDAGQGLASVEEGLARTLGIKLDDELLFSVAGVEKRVRVTSLRKLEWDSMRVNFFVLTPPGVIEDVPASYITSFHLSPENTALGTQLVAAFPNLTVIDVGAILAQLQGVIAQVSGAIQFIFVFTLLAGGIVLYAALLSAFDERQHELAVMRALGANRAQLRRAMLSELALVGGISGLIAAAGAMVLGRIVARQVFQMEMEGGFWLLPGAAVLGTGLAVSGGWWALRRLLQTPPLLALRAGA